MSEVMRGKVTGFLGAFRFNRHADPCRSSEAETHETIKPSRVEQVDRFDARHDALWEATAKTYGVRQFATHLI